MGSRLVRDVSDRGGDGPAGAGVRPQPRVPGRWPEQCRLALPLVEPWLPSPREPSRRGGGPCAQDRAIRCDLGYTVRGVQMIKFLCYDNARVSACLVMHHLADNASHQTPKT